MQLILTGLYQSLFLCPVDGAVSSVAVALALSAGKSVAEAFVIFEVGGLGLFQPDG
jgi:hypothetical protein